VKKVAAMVVLLGALLASSVAFAGNGAGIDARLARVDAHVAKYHSKCDVNPKQKCSAVKARLSARLAKIEGKLDARIAKAKNEARKAKLQAARDHIASLAAAL
jgi:Skp family chaperone for outer membrane proteins